VTVGTILQFWSISRRIWRLVALSSTANTRRPTRLGMRSAARVIFRFARLKGTVKRNVLPLPTSRVYLLSLPLTGFPINLLYSAKSVGEQSISLTSKLGACKSKRNLSSATQGLVYIFGSLIVTVSSK